MLPDSALNGLLADARELLDQLPAMVFTAGEMGLLASANRWGAQALGYQPEELAGRPFAELFHPEERERLRRSMAACLQNPKTPVRWDLRMIRKDGSVLRARQTARSVAGTDANAVFLLVCEEAAVADTAKTDSTTARAKADLLAQLGHELRTPVNIIISMVDLLLESGLDPERRSLAEAVRRSAALLESVSENILDYSKSEAGMMTLREEDFSLRYAVTETAGIFRERAASRGLKLTVEIADDAPDALHGDAGHLRRVLANLLANAVKFTAQGGVAVRVGCTAQSGDSATLSFSVEDTGIGIAHEAQRRLFQPFVQHHDPAGRRYSGTGLGLAIAKSLVELLGGAIQVHSIPGRGTVFAFSVPFQKRRD